MTGESTALEVVCSRRRADRVSTTRKRMRTAAAPYDMHPTTLICTRLLHWVEMVGAKFRGVLYDSRAFSTSTAGG